MSYFWDLDGNGTFGGGIDSSSAQPVVTGGYPSNGTYAVKLRVTDSNALTSIDTINVVVFGATATITGVSPSSADPGTTIPVTISGANLRGVTVASQFGVSGGGVTVTGTPVVNALGTQVTGLSFVVAEGIAGSARDVSVTNSDGSGGVSGNGTGVGRFTVNGGCTPPTVLAQPLSQSICPGGQVTFNVGASGGPFTYQWRRDTAPINGATASVYIINGASAGSEGSYDCIVSNACGPTLSDAAALSVDTSGISVQPSPQTICPGGTATFTIGVDGTADLQWRKDGVDIQGATGSSIVISPVEPSDVGVYDCTVTTACDFIISDGVSLAFGGGAAILVQPDSQSVCEGTDVSLTFGVSGATGYQWRKGGVDIQDATSSTLTIPAAAASDIGDYDCVAASPCGGTTSSVATVAVCSTVSIGTGPAARAVCPGGSATFIVNVSGSSLTYQWRKGTVPIDGATGASLTIAPAGQSDVDSYDCIVGNCCQDVTSQAASLTICVADFNCLGGVTVDDIFDYLNGWFANVPAADVNGVDGVTITDIFDFINAWLAGC